VPDFAWRVRVGGSHGVVEQGVEPDETGVWLSGGEEGFYASAFFLGLLVILAWGVQRRFPSPNSR
jgi:hypothetical protein